MTNDTHDTPSGTNAVEELLALPDVEQPAVSPSGERVAFYRSTTERTELWVRSVGTGDASRVATARETFATGYPIRWTPEETGIYTHQDRAGDERNDVWLVTLDGESRQILSDSGKQVLQDVSPDGRRLLFASDADGQRNLYTYHRRRDRRERLTDHDAPVLNAGYCGPGERVAYTTLGRAGPDDRTVHVAAADGSNARVVPVGGRDSATVLRACSPVGGKLLVSDDRTGELRPGVYDLDAGTSRWFGTDGRDEEPFAFTPDGDAFLALRADRAASVPVVYELDGTCRELDLPRGVSTFPFNRRREAFLDDTTVLVGHATSARREELLSYDLETDTSGRVREAEYGDLSPESFTRGRYVTFESVDGLEIGGLLYDSGRRPSPAVVVVHGGPHDRARREFSPEVQALVRSGYTVLQPNYRGSTGRGTDFRTRIHGDWGGGEQADVAAAGEWLRRRSWIDADRVAVYGRSYGGYATYMQLVTYPEQWAAGVAFAGVTDLRRLYAEATPPYRAFLREQMGDPEASADLWRERSPITHVERLQAPILVVHGANDPRCPLSQAASFVEALEERGLTEGDDFGYVVLDDGHDVTSAANRARTLRATLDHLDRWLG